MIPTRRLPYVAESIADSPLIPRSVTPLTWVSRIRNAACLPGVV